MVRIGRILRGVLVLGALAVTPAAAVTGRVVDGQGRPLAGARACLVQEGNDLLCTVTDEQGAYVLPASTHVPAVRITLEGHLPARVAAVDQESPVVLAPAASFHARLVDAATGEPVKGELVLADLSGRRRGPFPVSQGGLRVRTIEPGRVVPTGRAAGYRDGTAAAVDLVAGATAEITVRLARE